MRADKEVTQSLITVRERQRGRAAYFALGKKAWKLRQEFGVYRAEYPFDLTAPLRAGDC